jgi:alpha-glucoside transport system substrate-binding protein
VALQSAERTRLARAVVRQAVVAALLVVSGCLASNTRTGGHLGANRNTGRTISIVVAFGGAQFDAFKAGVEPYARSHHITIKWLVDSNFNADIVDRAKAGELPDIAMFPQPGILLQFARQGTIADLSKILDVADLRRQLVSGLLLPSTYNGDVYGIPPSINLKSVVFYPRKAWLRAGYPIPATLAQLMALTARIKADGRTPWCMGIEDTSATGWPATDWLEQLVLDLDGPDVYIRWVSHAVKFDSPPIRRAAQYFQTLFATPGFVHGGRKAIVSSNFATAGN